MRAFGSKIWLSRRGVRWCWWSFVRILCRARVLSPQVLFAKVGWNQGFDYLILICLVILSVWSVLVGGRGGNLCQETSGKAEKGSLALREILGIEKQNRHGVGSLIISGPNGWILTTSQALGWTFTSIISYNFILTISQWGGIICPILQMKKQNQRDFLTHPDLNNQQMNLYPEG